MNAVGGNRDVRPDVAVSHRRHPMGKIPTAWVNRSVWAIKFPADAPPVPHEPFRQWKTRYERAVTHNCIISVDPSSEQSAVRSQSQKAERGAFLRRARVENLPCQGDCQIIGHRAFHSERRSRRMGTSSSPTSLSRQVLERCSSLTSWTRPLTSTPRTYPGSWPSRNVLIMLRMIASRNRPAASTIRKALEPSYHDLLGRGGAGCSKPWSAGTRL